jgi:Tol biopolymer transport system component
MDDDGANQAQLTDHLGTDIVDGSPAWSPDGDRVAFVSTRTSTETELHIEVWVMGADGSSRPPSRTR